MGYRVVSRFFDRTRRIYVDVGAPCPDVAPDEAQRLVEARCLVEVADEPPPAATPRRRKDVPTPPAPPTAEE